MMFKKPAGVLMFLLVILKVLGTAATDCSSTCSATSCTCTGQDLTSVPQDLPTTITWLDLGENRITMSQSDFSRYRSLGSLWLDNNRISTINSQVFYHLSSLTELWLYMNRITALRSDMFTGLGNLVYLILWSNAISDIQAGTFTPTPQLRTLQLNYNKLTHLRSDMFTGLGNLGYLLLINNDITDIHAGTFNAMPQLTNLLLQGNKLTTLRSDMFTGLGNLQTLDLYNNDITVIPDHTFNPTPQLKFLNLSHNHIQSIASNLLSNLLNLTEFSLSNNRITVFPFEDLLNIQTIVTLHLDNNLLTTLPSLAYDILSSISDVNVDHNPWQCDCRMVDFRLKMTGTYPFENQTICFQPDHLHGQKLIDVSPEHLMSYCVPTIVRFERGENMTLYLGDTLHLVCEASGIPTPDITVTLPSGQHATVDSFGRVTVNVNGTIMIRDLTAEDSGRYVCTATNSVGFTRSILSIDVFYPNPPPTFSLAVIVGTVGGALAGIFLIVGIIIFIIRRKRRYSNQGTPVGQAFYSSAIATTTVITSGQDRTGQTQPISPSIRNPQPIPRPVSSVSEHSYEAVDPPPTVAFPRQTTTSLSSDVTHPLLARQSAFPNLRLTKTCHLFLVIPDRPRVILLTLSLPVMRLLTLSLPVMRMYLSVSMATNL